MGYVDNANLVANQFYMLGVNFEEVAADAEGININDLITGNFPQVASADYWDEQAEELGDGWMTDAAMIQVLKGKTYDFYYYITDAWYPQFEGDEEGATKAAWADIYACVAGVNADEYDGIVLPGEAVWFKSPAVCTATCKGQVVAAATDPVTVSADQFTMVANSFPEEFDLNAKNVTYTGLKQVATADYWDDVTEELGDGWMADADMIQILKGKTYDFYYYITDAWYPQFEGDEEGATKAAWADVYACVAGVNADEYDGIVGLGEGFWIKPHGAVTITFTK